MTSTAELLTLRPALPPGREVVLPGRGSTFVREVAGPPGAPTVVLLHGLGATADAAIGTTNPARLLGAGATLAVAA